MHIILVGKAKAIWDQADHLEPLASALSFVWCFLDAMRRRRGAPYPPGKKFVKEATLQPRITVRVVMSVQTDDAIWVHDIIVDAQ